MWSQDQLESLEALLSEFDWVDINNSAVLDAYVKIGVVLDQGLSTIPDPKLWVAAVASATGAALLTYDSDYRQLPEGLVRLEFIPRDELEDERLNE